MRAVVTNVGANPERKRLKTGQATGRVNVKPFK
jgi:hypothetical protein